jgi:hypothetical protein
VLELAEERLGKEGHESAAAALVAKPTHGLHPHETLKNILV